MYTNFPRYPYPVAHIVYENFFVYAWSERDKTFVKARCDIAHKIEFVFYCKNPMFDCIYLN